MRFILRIFYLLVLIACTKEQPRPPVTGDGEPNPCAQYADGVCPVYNAELEGSGAENDRTDGQLPTINNRPSDDGIEQSTTETEQPDTAEEQEPINIKEIAVHTGFVVKDSALYPLFLADLNNNRRITKSKFSYGGAGFEPQKPPIDSGLPFTFELVVTLEFEIDSSIFCARSSLDKSQLEKILQWKDQQLQADGFPLTKERGGYPNLKKMNIKEGACR